MTLGRYVGRLLNSMVTDGKVLEGKDKGDGVDSGFTMEGAEVGAGVRAEQYTVGLVKVVAVVLFTMKKGCLGAMVCDCVEKKRADTLLYTPFNVRVNIVEEDVCVCYTMCEREAGRGEDGKRGHPNESSEVELKFWDLAHLDEIFRGLEISDELFPRNSDKECFEIPPNFLQIFALHNFRK